MINWKVTKEENDLILGIVKRVKEVTTAHSLPFDQSGTLMDITACHANGCRLDLAGLLAASPFDFTHDVFGIMKNINRKTGKIENCFTPRYCREKTPA